MLDKYLHAHIDVMDEIETDIDIEIDKFMASLDIDEIIVNPETAMVEATQTLQKILIEKYADRAAKAGLDFAGEIKKLMAKGRDIVVPKTKDPNLNEGEIDRGESKDKS